MGKLPLDRLYVISFHCQDVADGHVTLLRVSINLSSAYFPCESVELNIWLGE